MLKFLFSTEAKPGGFFRRIDWTAFWSATAISFLVYFFTLGPSVGLEDSGELATAADHLGVPHPPGYPFWTLCCWIFCRVFSFVTYMGQPTPAWAVSLFSAVAGAFAAGCTAMLICRSGSDMLDSMDSDATGRVPPADAAQHHAFMSFAGGLGGALLFAFSPVEWSQSTIVEIYSLNALFLMAVFLLSYRWMRQPSHKILWLTAFVFGLGLTNYQVLLMAALPLAVIMFFRDIRLFRDFTLILIPVALTAYVLQIGSKMRASAEMAADVINKFDPVLIADSCPNVYLLWTAFACVVAAPIVGKALAVFTRKRNLALYGALATGLLGIALLALATTVFAEKPILVDSIETVVEGLKAGPLPCTWTNPEFAPLIQPAQYAWIALFLAAACILSLGAVFAPDDMPIYRFRVWGWLMGAGACTIVAGCLALLIPQAGSAGYRGEAFNWMIPVAVLAVGLVLLVVLSLLTPRQRGLAFAVPVASVQLVVFILLYKGAMNGLTHPTTWWFFWPCIWNFVMLGLATVALPNGRAIGPALFFAELGVSFYAYMPIVSDLRNPPMNWGYPRTWEGFKHAIMRGQYDSITIPYLYRPKGFNKLLGQMGSYFKDLRLQFTVVAAALALVPFALWKFAVRLKEDRRSLAVKAVSFSSVLYVAAAALVVVYAKLFKDLNNGEVPLRLDKWLLLGMALLAAAGVYLMLRRQLARIFSAILPWPGFRKTLVLLLLGLSAGAAAWIFFTCLTGRGFAGGVGFFSLDVATKEMIKEELAVEPKPENVRLVMALCVGAFLLFVAEIVRLVLAFVVRRRQPAVRANVLLDDVSQQWLIAVGSCFAIMSVFLVALANVTGDIQDGFIQKVKFTSSHGMFSLWIGYGLVVGVVVANRLVARFTSNARVRRALLGIFCLCAASAALIPVYENYTNDRLVFEMGAAEQNGHTFGWQFGNYQLRGANAIREELSPDEEPLPNPLWPEEMGPNAVFFGGTDPGRFVPTYMIYSAKVREDVKLITQNALADDTYMSVERDLYGDDIWIPAKNDSSDAFSEYVNSMTPEERLAKGVVMENGRVQVTGALSVMDINGILTKKMFDHERLRRDFYVEESYVIRWMYPHLTPHGLIMKINNETTLLNDALVRDDMEFWDWYTRRLLRDPAFRRDFVAQKSFSKLRAAIAGLYANRRKLDVSAQAFREAVSLYPASPEATFRYIQEILGPSDKWDAIHDLISYTDRVDPHNTRTKDLRKKVSRARDAVATMNEILRESDIVRKYLSRAPQKLPNAAHIPFPAEILNQLSDNDLDRLADARLDYGEANLAFGRAQLAYYSALWLQNNPAHSNSFKRLRRSTDIFSKLGRFSEASSTVLAAQKFPEANTYDVQHESALILAQAGRAEESAKAIQSAMTFPESQKFDVLLQYADLLAKLGKNSDALQTVERAVSLATNAPPEQLLASVESVLRIGGITYVPYVDKNILTPLLARTDTTWMDFQRISEYYKLFSQAPLTKMATDNYREKAVDSYSQFAEALDNGGLYQSLADMYARAASSLPEDRRLEYERKEAVAKTKAARAYLKQACRNILSSEPDLESACWYVEKADKSDHDYIHETYLKNPPATNATPLSMDSVKALLVRKVLNSH